MKITDGKKMVEITMQVWTGNGYEADFANDFFGASELKYDMEQDAYLVDDVDYCIEMANDYKAGRGDYSDVDANEDLVIEVEEI